MWTLSSQKDKFKYVLGHWLFRLLCKCMSCEGIRPSLSSAIFPGPFCINPYLSTRHLTLSSFPLHTRSTSTFIYFGNILFPSPEFARPSPHLHHVPSSTTFNIYLSSAFFPRIDSVATLGVFLCSVPVPPLQWLCERWCHVWALLWVCIHICVCMQVREMR